VAISAAAWKTAKEAAVAIKISDFSGFQGIL
jgi:hypothetical protein